MKVIKKDKDVIAKEEERKEADKLNEEFYNTGIPEEMTDDASDESEWELSPVEDMSIQIAGYLSDLTSERFAAMVDGMEVDTIKQIVGRLNGAGHEEAVRMMQAMFLISGMEYAAEDLDILSFIEDFDECVYDFFIDDIFSTDFFDWFLTEMCLEKAYKPACLPPILS